MTRNSFFFLHTSHKLLYCPNNMADISTSSCKKIVFLKSSKSDEAGRGFRTHLELSGLGCAYFGVIFVEKLLIQCPKVYTGFEMLPKGGSSVPLPAAFSFVTFSNFVDFLFRIHNPMPYQAALPLPQPLQSS